MSIAPTNRTHRQSIDRHGSSVTLTNYTEGTRDDYGRDWTETTNSPYTITARVWVRQTPTVASDEYDQGKEDVDVNFAIKDDASGVGEIRDGGGKGASELEFENEIFYVLNIDRQKQGIIILECRNK